MKENMLSSRVLEVCLISGGLWLLGLGNPSLLHAQTTGQIAGRVIDASSGDVLPGANVVLEGTSYGAATNRRGRYRLENVAPGRYTLRATYIGFENFSTEIEVGEGEAVQQNIALEPGVVQGEEILVQGLRRGQAKALTRQKTATTIKNVVSREQMRLFPDANTAEVLQRVPGVNIQRSRGEGKFVFLRGIGPRLTAVTVNGEKLPTSEDEERYSALDVISSNQLASIEVIKALTPDMDANAIGGTIDLETRSPYDFEGRAVRVSLGGGYNELGSKPLYQAALTYSDLFGADDQFGFSVNANFNQINRVSHNNEMEWGSEETVSGEEIPFALQTVELRHFYNRRDRYGVNAAFEYHPSAMSLLFVRGMVNKRDDYEIRNRFRARIDDGDYQSPTSVTEARLQRELQERTESQLVTAVSAGGEHRLGDLSLAYTVYYAYAQQNKDGSLEPVFRFDDVDLNVDLSNPNTPRFSAPNLEEGALYNPSNYETDAFDYRNEFTSDQNIIGSLDLSYPYRLASHTADLKFGAKVRLKRKDRDDGRAAYSWQGDEALTLARFSSDRIEEGFLNGSYSFGPSINPDKIRDFFQENRSSNFEEEVNYEETLGENYTAHENIYAAYVMTTVNIGELLVLAGMRNEYTVTDYVGTRLEFNEEGDFEGERPISDTKSYNYLFPMVHFRYRLEDNTNLRLAGTTGIARPNFFDIIPYFWLSREDEEIRRGNASLEATYAYNLDLMGEHYFQRIGILAVGLFYKKLNNVIYRRVFDQEGGPFDGYEVEQPVNGGNADVYGLEVNWQQQFTFLPGFLGGFGIYGNYTHTETRADLLYRETETLPGQAGNSGNLALTYSKYGFNARISLNYNGKFIDEVGESKAEDRWIDDHTQLDFSANYQVSSRFDVFLDVVNLTNEPARRYRGVEDRPDLREFYSWLATVGVRYSL